MKVLHVCAPGRIGGLESVVAQLTTGLRSRGIDAQVALIGPRANADITAYAERLQAAGVPVHRVDVGGRQYQRERAVIRQLLQSGSFAVLHSHGYRADVVDGPVARQAGCAHVMTLHGFTGKGLRGRFYEFLQVRRAARADATIAVSSAIGARVRRAGGEAHVIRNAIGEPTHVLSRTAARERLGIMGETPCIGWVGRLSFEKGPDIALEAVAQIAESVRLVFVGDGPMRAELETRWHNEVRTGRVVFVGMQDDARSLMHAFDVLAITSRTEGTPITLLEAMWARTPTVVSAVGGIPDVVDDTMCELVAPEPSAFAAAIRRVLHRDPAQCSKLDAAERHVRLHHGEGRWLDMHLDVYRGLKTVTSWT